MGSGVKTLLSSGVEFWLNLTTPQCHSLYHTPTIHSEKTRLLVSRTGQTGLSEISWAPRKGLQQDQGLLTDGFSVAAADATPWRR